MFLCVLRCIISKSRILWGLGRGMKVGIGGYDVDYYSCLTFLEIRSVYHELVVFVWSFIAGAGVKYEHVHQ